MILKVVQNNFIADMNRKHGCIVDAYPFISLDHFHKMSCSRSVDGMVWILY
jgi:hypothetical protein